MKTLKTKYGRLTVSGDPFQTQIKNKTILFVEVVCDCGVTKTVRVGNLSSGSTKSCGCLSREKSSERATTHGQCETLTYSRWCAMNERCNGYKERDRKQYTDRGISVCGEWLDFENFKRDMGDPPTPHHSLDRIDNDAGYSKENCRWATMEEQQNNRSCNVFIEHGGKRQTVAQWSRELGVCRKALMYRVKHGWSAEMALSMGYKHSNRIAK